MLKVWEEYTAWRKQVTGNLIGIPEDWGETLELETEGGEPEEYVEEQQRSLLSDLLPPKRRKMSNMVIPSTLTTHITDLILIRRLKLQDKSTKRMNTETTVDR